MRAIKLSKRLFPKDTFFIDLEEDNKLELNIDSASMKPYKNIFKPINILIKQ